MSQRTAFDWLGMQAPETPEDVMAANDKAAYDAQIKAINEARIFHNVFNTPDGLALLDILRSQTIEVPLIRVSNTFGGGEINLSGAEWAFFRDGQNSVIRHIELQMLIATQPIKQEESDNGSEN